MNPPPNECAAGSLCQGAGKTLGNHYCCRCKKTVHSVFCSKEVDSLEGNIKESFKDDEQKGSFKEVCNLGVEKATDHRVRTYEVIRIEVEELLDEGLVDDVKVDDEDGKVDSDDEDDDVEMVEEEEVVTIETINDLCAQLHQMSAKVQKFKCDGDEFSGVASKFSDLSSTLRLSYKRLESNRVANKQKKAPRQGTLFPFINVRGGSK